MSEVDNIAVSKYVLSVLNAWPDKIATVKPESLDKSAPAMMMQSLAGNPVERKYVNGSFIGRYPFAVYARVDGRDTQLKLQGFQALEKLCDHLKSATLPAKGANRQAIKVENTSTPTTAAEHDNGMVDLMAVFSLQYKQGG
jgi:hypothetical protein